MTAFYRTDRFGNPLGRLGYVYSAQRDRTTNGTDVLDISCKTQCDKGDRIVFIDSAGNPREYIITDLEQTREDSLDFTYHCSNSITELALFFIEERRSRSENAQQMLTRVLEGTRWHVGNVTTGGANNLSFYHVSAYQAILDICELWGLEWETQLTISADGSHIDGRSINLVPHVGSTSARRFDFGKNLVGLSRTVDSTNVITRLYPYGNSVQETDASGEATGGYSRKIDISSVNGGKTYIEDTSATLVWGVPDASGQVQPAMGMQEYDADDPATLLAMAQADLPNLTQPKVSYTATVATLGIEGVDRYGIGVGDDVYVIDTAYPTPIRLKGRVLEIVDDLVDPLSDDTQITLGNLVETYTADMDRVSGIVDMLTSNSGIWNDAANATPSYIDSVIAGLNQQLNQTGGYVYLEPNEGLIVYDKPKDENPTMAIQLGGGYFRIANSKKSDGSWDWRTAGTGAGLVADVLVAGIIAGGSNWWNLETGDLSFTQGTIGRSDGSTYWNLTTGDFRFAPTSSIGDTGNTIGGTVVGTNIQYGLSDSESTVPSSWTDTAEWVKGKVLWSRTVSKSADGTVTYGTPQVIIGANGNGVSSVREQYYLSQSNTTQTGGTWNYAQPAWVKGRYYWTRSEITWSDGSVSYTTPVLANALTSGNQSTNDLDSALNQQGVFNRLTNNGALEGLYMEAGRLYINASYMKAGIITDNVGRNFWNLNTGEFSLSATNTEIGGVAASDIVVRVDVQYGLSTSETTEPTSWGTSAQWSPGHCLWSRQKITLLNDAVVYSEASRITDLNGMGAYQVREQYYLSTSSSSQSGGSWSYAQPSWVNGRYYWTRSEITMSDGSKQYTTPVLASGLTSGNQSTADLDNSLNQLDVFNRLTNNGQTQGLYLSDGLLYINGQYIKANSITSNSIAAGQFSGYVFTGAIYQSSTANNTGFKLRDSGLDMWDSSHNHTVHLDGNGGDNLLTGTFQTALSGRRVRISPDFSQYEVADQGASIIGSGIQLFLDGTAASHPYIASESSVSDEGQVSGIVINGGHRGDGDPGAFLRVGERGAPGDRYGNAIMKASQKYSDASSPHSYVQARAPQGSGPTAIIRAENGAGYAGYYANSDQGYSYMYAGDSNGNVGVQADIRTGYLYLGGYLGGITGRHTFQSTQWRMRTGSTPHNYAGEVTWTFGTPAKYGTYVGVASADTEWAGIIIHPCKTNSASGMGIKLFNADVDTTVDIYAAALAWLKK